MKEYNGYKNYETWNVVLWINNDESFYDFACQCTKSNIPYASFVEDMKIMDCFETPDGVSWTDPLLDFDVLNLLIKELK